MCSNFVYLINRSIWKHGIKKKTISFPRLYFQPNTLLVIVSDAHIRTVLLNRKRLNGIKTNERVCIISKQIIYYKLTSNGNMVSPPSSTSDKYNRKEAICVNSNEVSGSKESYKYDRFKDFTLWLDCGPYSVGLKTS